MRLGQISTHDVMHRVKKLSDTPRQQHYVFTVTKAFFRWAVRNRYLESCPLQDLTIPMIHNSRERTLSQTEVQEFYAKARNNASMFSDIVKLIVLTGQRRGEIAALRWEWVEGDTITYPGTFTKNKRTHRLPTPERAQRILERQSRESEWVFPEAPRVVRGRETTFFNSWSKSKRQFDQSLKNVEPYNLHDLGRTFSTRLAELGIPIHVTERLLNHA